MTKVTIDIEKEQYQLLKDLAKKDDSSIVRVVRKLVKSYIASNSQYKPQIKSNNKGENKVFYNEDGSIEE